MTVSRTEPMKMKMSAVITNTPHGGTCSFVLMAIPLFIFAGTIVPGAQISIAWLYFAVLISGCSWRSMLPSICAKHFAASPTPTQHTRIRCDPLVLIFRDVTNHLASIRDPKHARRLAELGEDLTLVEVIESRLLIMGYIEFVEVEQLFQQLLPLKAAQETRIGGRAVIELAQPSLLHHLFDALLALGRHCAYKLLP
jgi:hypothetical protein